MNRARGELEGKRGRSFRVSRDPDPILGVGGVVTVYARSPPVDWEVE
jgi:hypothetical protein